jgi:monofunctional biosynthetic peptidoglycan transglycosylase
MLFDFTSSEAEDAWQAVNDGVMGGLSRGAPKVRHEEGVLEFSGTLSLENSGGFSSIRSRGPELDLSGFDGISVQYRGDGRQYFLTVETDLRLMAGSYRAELPAAEGAWVTVRLPFSGFEATSFGRTLAGAPALNRNVVRSIGFILADKTAGPFHLEVERIVAYRDAGRDDEPRTVAAGASVAADSSTDGARRLIELAIRRGVPLYNHGNPDACAAVYEVTAHALVAMSEDLPGEDRRMRLEDGLRRLQSESDASRRAWGLRHMLDDVYRSLKTPGTEG